MLSILADTVSFTIFFHMHVMLLCKQCLYAGICSLLVVYALQQKLYYIHNFMRNHCMLHTLTRDILENMLFEMWSDVGKIPMDVQNY